MSSVTSTDTASVLLADEILRTRAFLWLSGGLAVVGALASFALDGDSRVGAAFRLSVLALVAGYAALYVHMRREDNYSPAKALVVVAVCNLAGVVASLYYGLFSPCPMILMIPIAFFGLSRSGAAATGAYFFAAGSMFVAMLMVTVAVIPDPGVLQPDLEPLQKLLFACLVQAVYAVAFVLARVSRRATATAVAQMEAALNEVEQRQALLDEAHERLEVVLGGGQRGPLSGQALGDWVLGPMLGRGAMGDVYASTGLGQDAAVKVLNPVAANNPATLLLFEREARALQSIRGHNVIRFLDHGTAPTPYVVMERVYGETLEDRLRKQNALSIEAVLVLVEQVSAGLEAVHAAGLVHRDVKPSNLMAARTEHGGEIWKVFDFGVAKDLHDEHTLTMGLVVGTPSYMSPEQLRGRAVDARADVYSLAATVYRALTGRRPYTGRTLERMIVHALQDRPVRPSASAPVPPQVELVLALAMATEAEHRPRSVAAFRRALEAGARKNLDTGTKARARPLLAEWPRR